MRVDGILLMLFKDRMMEGMHVGTVAAGRIGLDALRKMKPFDVHLLYLIDTNYPTQLKKS